MREEIWREINNFPNYQISNLGRVRRMKGFGCPETRILKPQKGGYPSIKLSKEGEVYQKEIHCLVAETFLGPRPPGLTINHKDGDKKNNSNDNLEYVTYLENAHHARVKGLYKDKKITFEQSILIKKSVLHPKILAEKYSCSISNIRHIQKGKCFKWTEKSL